MLGGTGRNKAGHKQLLDKIGAKLSAWKEKLLNLAGRATSVHLDGFDGFFHAIDMASIRSVWWSWQVSSKFDLILSSKQDAMGVPLLGWAKVTRQKAAGGWGFRSTRLKNVALHGKLSWEMFNGSDKLFSFFCSFFKLSTWSMNLFWTTQLHSSQCLSFVEGFWWREEWFPAQIRWVLADQWGREFPPLFGMTSEVDGTLHSLRVGAYYSCWWISEILSEAREWNLQTLRTLIPKDVEEPLSSACEICAWWGSLGVAWFGKGFPINLLMIGCSRERWGLLRVV